MRRLNAGEIVDQSAIDFRAAPKFETDAPGLEWMTRAIFVATGERYPNGVKIRFWRVPNRGAEGALNDDLKSGTSRANSSMHARQRRALGRHS